MKDSNIIDLSQRRAENDNGSKTKEHLKLRLDLEQAKILVTTSLISVLFLVTLANNSLMSAPVAQVHGESPLLGRGPASTRGQNQGQTQSQIQSQTRNVASVPTGTSQWEDEMVARMAKLDVDDAEKVGRRPSSLDRLRFEFLEGKYAVRLENGKIDELEFADPSQSGDFPKFVNDRVKFLEINRDLLPVQFVKSVRTKSAKQGDQTVERYNLLNTSDVPVAKVEFHLDSAGRLLSMKVLRPRVALN